MYFDRTNNITIKKEIIGITGKYWRHVSSIPFMCCLIICVFHRKRLNQSQYLVCNNDFAPASLPHHGGKSKDSPLAQPTNCAGQTQDSPLKINFNS